MPSLPGSLSKNYCTRANVPFAINTSSANAAKNWLWLLKAALKNEITTGTLTGARHANSVWTCVGSSDGVTAAFDANDRWGTVSFDPTKIVQASSGTAHSWILLQNTTLGMQILIDGNVATTSSARIAATKISEPFTVAANPLHSPNVPSPTNRAFQSGSTSTDATSNSVQFFYYNSDATAAFFPFFGHFTFTDDGQFFALHNRGGDGSMCGGNTFIKATSPHASDQYTFYWIAGLQNAAPPFPGGSNINTGSFCVGRDVVGGASDGGVNVWNFAGSSHASITTFSDQFSSKVKFYTPHIWSVARHAYRGYMADCYLMIGGRAGVLIPSAASPNWISLNRFIVPWVGEAPNL